MILPPDTMGVLGYQVGSFILRMLLILELYYFQVTRSPIFGLMHAVTISLSSHMTYFLKRQGDLFTLVDYNIQLFGATVR